MVASNLLGIRRIFIVSIGEEHERERKGKDRTSLRFIKENPSSVTIIYLGNINSR